MNAQDYFTQMISKNPNSQRIMQAIQNNNGNFQNAFYELAKEKGVTPEEFMKKMFPNQK